MSPVSLILSRSWVTSSSGSTRPPTLTKLKSVPSILNFIKSDLYRNSSSRASALSAKRPPPSALRTSSSIYSDTSPPDDHISGYVLGCKSSSPRLLNHQPPRGSESYPTPSHGSKGARAYRIWGGIVRGGREVGIRRD